MESLSRLSEALTRLTVASLMALTVLVALAIFNVEIPAHAQLMRTSGALTLYGGCALCVLRVGGASLWRATLTLPGLGACAVGMLGALFLTWQPIVAPELLMRLWLAATAVAVSWAQGALALVGRPLEPRWAWLRPVTLGCALGQGGVVALMILAGFGGPLLGRLVGLMGVVALGGTLAIRAMGRGR